MNFDRFAVTVLLLVAVALATVTMQLHPVMAIAVWLLWLHEMLRFAPRIRRSNA